MKSMIKLAIVLCGLAVINVGVATADQTKKPSWFVIGHYHDFIDEKLTPEQSRELVIIAGQAAAASICDGIELDEVKFKAAFAKLAHASEAKMSEEEKGYFEKHLMLVYGIAIGGFLADASADTGAYCAAAEAERKEPEFQAISIYK